MELDEQINCSFIIKVWVEEIMDDTGERLWRGHITHVISGQRQYFEDLASIVGFVKGYLAEIGIQVNELNEPFFKRTVS